MSAAVRFWFFKSPVAERARGSSDSEEQPKLCSAVGNFPGLHKTPAATGKHPEVFSKFLQPPYLQKFLCHHSQASLGLCPSSLAFH